MERAAGLIYGPESHHLDHLAPLSLLMQIPLIATEEEIADDARRYYPGLQVEFLDYLHVAQKIVEDYDIIFSCLPRDLFDEVFFFAQKLLRKKIHTIWAPHGNSDKGHLGPFMEGLKKEEVALVYGKKMIDFLMKKHVLNLLKAYVITGNFRYTYYVKNKSFYDAIVSEEIAQRLKKDVRTILYAPTWQDCEKSSSFFSACPILIENLPEEYSLIVKLHPNLLLQNGIKTEEVIWKYEDRPNVLFLTDFPPVYPLLDFVDLYIGDMSSIGYDFLAFNKPMFFLNQNKRSSKEDPGLYLYRCGIEVHPEQYPEIYKLIDRHLPSDTSTFSSIRKEVYEYTFGKEKKWDDLREEIRKTYSLFSDTNIEFM